ncbi:YkvA family protein [Piscinibacter sp.]|uniref:YkvA family protein n=1 Tax=Piscinibacter sp. TaxID=1903157 RepID=UPI0039E4778C
MRWQRWMRAARGARLATYLIALWKLFRHPETPRAAKWVAIAVIAYAASPIDLIPDFIPVLGQLDDLILLPLGVALAVRLTPRPLWEARLREAEASTEKLPSLWWGAALVVLVWALLFGLFVWWLLRTFAAA